MSNKLIIIIEKICYLLPVIFIVMVSKCNFLYYIQSDDYQMNYISMGGITGVPDEHLVFIKSIYGIITRFLYNINPKINWFGLIYIIIILVLIYTMFLVLSAHINTRVALILSLVLEIITICLLTFTTIAYFCIAVGLMAIIEGVIKEGDKLKKFTLLFAGVFLVVCSYTLRSTAMITGLLLALPALIISANKLIRTKEFYVTLIGIAIFISIVIIIDNKSYDSKMWKEYKTFNSVRTQVVDYPIDEYKDNEQVYKKLSMSENDVNCIKDWIFADKKVFSTDKLSKVANSTKLTTRYNLKFQNILKNFLKTKETYILLAISILLVSLCARQKQKLIIVLQAIITYGSVLSLIVLNRFLPRVYIPIFIVGALNVCFIYLIGNEKTNKTMNKKKIILLISVFLVISISTTLYLNMYKGKVNKRKVVETEFRDLRQYILNHKDVVFISDYMFYIVNYQSVLDINAPKPYINLMNIGHWNIYDEAYYKQVNEYKLSYKDRLLIDIANDKNVLFIDGSVKKTRQMIETEIFIREHTNKKIKVVPIKKFGKSNSRIYSIEYMR